MNVGHNLGCRQSNTVMSVGREQLSGITVQHEFALRCNLQDHVLIISVPLTPRSYDKTVHMVALGSMNQLGVHGIASQAIWQLYLNENFISFWYYIHILSHYSWRKAPL